MASQEPVERDISKSVSACKALLNKYPTFYPESSELRQSAKRQQDGFSALEPDLAVIAHSSAWLDDGEVLRNEVTQQLSVLQTNLKFGMMPRSA